MIVYSLHDTVSTTSQNDRSHGQSSEHHSLNYVCWFPSHEVCHSDEYQYLYLHIYLICVVTRFFFLFFFPCLLFLSFIFLCLFSSFVLQCWVFWLKQFPRTSHMPTLPGLWKSRSIKMTHLAKQIQTLGQKMLNWVGRYKTAC